MEASGYRRARRKDAVQDDAVPFASAFLHRISRVDNNRKGSHRVLTLLPTGDYAVEFHENREFDCKATKKALFDRLRGHKDDGTPVGDGTPTPEWERIQQLSDSEVKFSPKLMSAAWCVNMFAGAACCAG